MRYVIQNVEEPQRLKSWLIWSLWKVSQEFQQRKNLSTDKIKCKQIYRDKHITAPAHVTVQVTHCTTLRGAIRKALTLQWPT